MIDGLSDLLMKQYFNNNRSNTMPEIRFKFRQRDILRKKLPKSQIVDQNAIDHKNLALVPYNLANHFITLAQLQKIFDIVDINIAVHNLELYQRAFVHISYITASLCDGEEAMADFDPAHDLQCAIPALIEEGYLHSGFDLSKKFLMPLQPISSERLEFLGDSVCGMAVAAYLYDRYPDEDEGFMTRIRTRLVCGSRLGNFAEHLGLQNHLIISRYVEVVNNGRSNYKILEDIFEAFIGAMFLDNGNDSAICYDFIVKVMQKFVSFEDLIATENNHKDVLLRSFQRFFEGAYPVYREISVDVQDGRKIYTMGVLNPEGTQIVGVGTSARKRNAEQLSSLEALKYYGWIDENQHNPQETNDQD